MLTNSEEATLFANYGLNKMRYHPQQSAMERDFNSLYQGLNITCDKSLVNYYERSDPF